MAIEKLTIEAFLEMSIRYPILDVRSPGEYLHAQIPGAYSLPLFTDEERKQVGTAYKQQSKKTAIRIGLDFFGVKMKAMVDEAEKIILNYGKEPGIKKNKPGVEDNNIVLVHCWRGGMRSAAVAWLLDLYGFEVYLLEGGYKAYRGWVMAQFEAEYNLAVIGGYTGSGKTGLLEKLKEMGHSIINLEGLANHKGSAFGEMGEQPTQEMFENLLAKALIQEGAKGIPIWVEDESQRIGKLNIPKHLWNLMRTKPLFFVDIPFEERLNFIVSTYGLNDKEKLVNAIIRIQKRLGPLETKTAIGFLIEDNFKACFEILLKYYDKSYYKGLNNRENLTQLLNNINCSFVDIKSNTEKLLTCTIANT